MTNRREPSPFRYRNGWRAQITLKNGQRPFEDFDNFEEAKQWLVDQRARADTDKPLVLGGPTKATLADMLSYYAEHYSLKKGGVDQELIRSSSPQTSGTVANC